MKGSEGYRDETRLEHMLQALTRISAESKTLTRDNLYFEDRTSRAIMFDFVVLGEAANNMSQEYCQAHPEVPWQDVAGIRHKIVHDYAGIDYGILWDAITKDVPALLPVVAKLVEALPRRSPSDEQLDEFVR